MDRAANDIPSAGYAVLSPTVPQTREPRRDAMSSNPSSSRPDSPVGRTAAQAASERAARSEEYRAARDEYAGIRELHKTDPRAARLLERCLVQG